MSKHLLFYNGNIANSILLRGDILVVLLGCFRQWWASYFLKVTSYKLQLLGKKSNQVTVTVTNLKK